MKWVGLWALEQLGAEEAPSSRSLWKRVAGWVVTLEAHSIPELPIFCRRDDQVGNRENSRQCKTKTTLLGCLPFPKGPCFKSAQGSR